MTSYFRIALWMVIGLVSASGLMARLARAASPAGDGGIRQQPSATAAAPQTQGPILSCPSLKLQVQAWASKVVSDPASAKRLAIPCTHEQALVAKDCAQLESVSDICRKKCEPRCQRLGSPDCGICINHEETCNENWKTYVEVLESIYDASYQCRYYDCSLALNDYNNHQSLFADQGMPAAQPAATQGASESTASIRDRVLRFRKRCLECKDSALDPDDIDVVFKIDRNRPVRPRGLASRVSGGVLLGLGIVSLIAAVPLTYYNGRVTDTNDCAIGGVSVPCTYNYKAPVAVTWAIGIPSVVIGIGLLTSGCLAGCRMSGQLEAKP